MTYGELKYIAQDRRKKNISLAELNGRSAISNLENKQEVPQIQRRNTFNIFHLERGGGHLRLPTNIVPPILHIHICKVNKVLKALDGIVTLWEKKMHHISTDASPVGKNLAYALARCAARRESY